MSAGIGFVMEEPTDMPYKAYVARYMRADYETREGIRKGIADIKAGRTTPWSEIKRELRLDNQEASR